MADLPKHLQGLMQELPGISRAMKIAFAAAISPVLGLVAFSFLHAAKNKEGN